jgi:hypothetical protein
MEREREREREERGREEKVDRRGDSHGLRERSKSVPVTSTLTGVLILHRALNTCKAVLLVQDGDVLIFGLGFQGHL